MSPGVYPFQYEVCDLQSTPKCATTTDTVTVTVSIIANANTGNAIAGTPGSPIVNVAANDTINGLPAVPGPGGNATVAQFGTWPAGITLNTTTGAVSITANVGPGTYTFQYQLCDLNTPPDCATSANTIVVAAAIVATAQNGTATAGGTFTAIANVAANDSVNGFPAVLGAAGNSTIAEVGTWPSGITLNVTSGAVTTSPAVPVVVRMCRDSVVELPCRCGDGGSRTLTGGGLSALPLPIGLRPRVVLVS